ncbi:MAG: MBL fold metallo-hydrolase [Candidatus Dadabacteria bacterium]|nr:ribonuclease Z [Candidatus Dadabacteria bacterium]NIV41581.1 MBL fold metallo-hydrolase [Candidatus Dadabacteria bacterium]NIX15143.1 MBL fold metallo-hydrolase [Candidatus Dadabacteria bacterium]NIY21788.1 MBL fold metallo-hydrolase [Candidatus Dadabacteria bacterium]
MKIIILGSGTCIPNKNRGSSGYYIETSDNKILFDCGSGTTWKLEKTGISYTEISHIFISHIHPDHTADLIPLLFANKYPYNRKRTRKLQLWGPERFKDFYRSLNDIYNNWINPDLLEVNEIHESRIEFSDFVLSSAPGLHSIDSLIYKIESNGRSVVYSGDTDYCEQIVSISKNADLLIAECSLTDDRKVKGHMTPKDIIRIAREATPKKVILTHLYPVCDEVDIIGQIKPHIKSEIVKAEDFMELDLQF